MSKEKLLREGDVFALKKGMTVYTDISERFAYSNRSGVNTPTHSEVKVGHVYNDGGVVWDSSDLCGEYLVIHTAFGGGGTGMGPHDVYPDGHHVYAMKIGGSGWIASDDGVKVDFYQSGCFTAMNENVPVLRHMNKRVTWES